jgi:hypothetical protein
MRESFFLPANTIFTCIRVKFHVPSFDHRSCVQSVFQKKARKISCVSVDILFSTTSHRRGGLPHSQPPGYKLSTLSIGLSPPPTPHTHTHQVYTYFGLSPKCIPICHDDHIVVVFVKIQSGFGIAHKLFDIGL